jgi:hypothetical protein
MVTQDRTWSQEQSPSTAARDSMREAADQARGYLDDRMQQAKRVACDELAHIADALQAAGRKLEDEGDGWLARYVEQGAQWSQRSARYVEEHDLRDLAGSARDAVRQHPQWALAGLFAAGMAMGRLLKASAGEGQSGQAPRADADVSPEQSPGAWAQQSPHPAAPSTVVHTPPM